MAILHRVTFPMHLWCFRAPSTRESGGSKNLNTSPSTAARPFRRGKASSIRSSASSSATSALAPKAAGSLSWRGRGKIWSFARSFLRSSGARKVGSIDGHHSAAAGRELEVVGGMDPPLPVAMGVAGARRGESPTLWERRCGGKGGALGVLQLRQQLRRQPRC